MVKSENTESKILAAARKVFMKKGLNGARMQEIADEAGINKALLHYYFRSKDKLFYAIFQEAFSILIPYVSDIFNSDQPLHTKLSRLAEKYTEILETSPYLPMFVLSEIQQNPDRIAQTINIHEFVNIQKLADQIRSEYKIELLDPGLVVHVFVNFLSNLIFPIIARPIIQFNLKMKGNEFHEFLAERKKLVPYIFIETVKSMNDYVRNKK